MLAEHAERGQAVAPVGGGTKLALGNIPTRVDTALSTAKLSRVLHYEPTDMTLSVEAGIRFGELQAILAERGQTLPIETPDDDRATIGGLIATAMAGPRRLGSGTLRDLLIGISCAYASGIVAKAGGLVVKNVTGFDLMRLHLGAMGTLGVIVSANFKVLPLARTEATLLTELLPLNDAIAAAEAARGGRLRPVAVEVFKHADAWQTAVRIEGRAETVGHGIGSLQSIGNWAESLRDDESKSWWRAYVGRQNLSENGSELVVRCGVEPKRSGNVLREIDGLLASHDISPEFIATSPRLGSIIAGAGSSAVTSFASVHAALLGIAESVTVLKAPVSLKQSVDVWGKVPETIDVMRAMKAEFDPANVLNPGRFIDRI